MHAGFVRGMRRRFELERRVLDVEVTGKTALQLVQQLRRTPVGETSVVDDHVR